MTGVLCRGGSTTVSEASAQTSWAELSGAMLGWRTQPRSHRPYCCVGSQGPRVPGACCSQKDGLSLAHISLGSQSRSSHSAKRPICPVAPITGAQLLQPPTLRTVALGHGALEAMACEMCPVGKEGDLAFVTSFCPAGSGLKGF